MNQTNKTVNQRAYQVPLAKPMLVGAALALLAISFFVFGVDRPHPEWGKYWQLRPLTLTPLAGALGGAFYAFMDFQSARGFNRTLAVLISITAYFVGLWLGIVIGLAGTMWN